jgi:hypothetical protein
MDGLPRSAQSEKATTRAIASCWFALISFRSPDAGHRQRPDDYDSQDQDLFRKRFIACYTAQGMWRARSRYEAVTPHLSGEFSWPFPVRREFGSGAIGRFLLVDNLSDAQQQTAVGLEAIAQPERSSDLA